MATTTLMSEVLEVGTHIDTAAHRPVCSCGWVGRSYPLGYLPTARATLAAHRITHE